MNIEDYTMSDMKEIYAGRCSRLAGHLAEQNLDAIVFIDREGNRTPSIRYFSGHPSDAILVISAAGDSVLIPWDVNLAQTIAVAGKVIPYTRFERQAVPAVKGALQQLKLKEGKRIEIPSCTPYPEFLKFVDALAGNDVLCREKGAYQFVDSMRAVKDEYELACIRRACAVTDGLVDKIEEGVRSGSIRTESDAALLIEKELREQGCESTGFDTLAAGPGRSFGIHCFPPYTNAPFGTAGLSILDFGVKYKGYTSDVTMTIAREPLSEDQRAQLELVESAYNESLKLYEAQLSVRAPAMKADSIFSKKKRNMPHSLGHGVGLECHEYPVIRERTDAENLFKAGMVVTLEPGLYDPEFGGCRLENDVLITETGCEVLTHSRIVRIQD